MPNTTSTSEASVGLHVLAPPDMLQLLLNSNDILLLIDQKGIIKETYCDPASELKTALASLSGQPWRTTVTADSVPIVDILLTEAKQDSYSSWHQINQKLGDGASRNMQFRLIQSKTSNYLLAYGRDLQQQLQTQQQLIDAQQTLERDHWRFRQIESRYRMLFQTISEPTLVLDAHTQRVIEANPAASKLFHPQLSQLLNLVFPDDFSIKDHQLINRMLGSVRTSGKSNDLRTKCGSTEQDFLVSASLLREDHTTYLLVRMMPHCRGEISSDGSGTKELFLGVMNTSPDAIVITNSEGQVMTSNPSFLSLCEVATLELARNRSLSRWLGRPGVDFNVLMANLRQHTTIRLFTTTLTGEYGTATKVEISATQVQQNSNHAYFGFFIRDIGRRIETNSAVSTPHNDELLNQLTERIGRVPLRELVRESTDAIERICIETALKMTGTNRAAAAELLGLSRQSLYVKMDKYNITEDTPLKDE